MNATRAVIMGHALLGLAVSAFIGTHVVAQDAPYPLAPCEHVIMMSAPDKSDGGILAYCAGSQMFTYDQQDGRWYHMTFTHLRGFGVVPVRDERVTELTKWADMVGDHRAVGLYE